MKQTLFPCIRKHFHVLQTLDCSFPFQNKHLLKLALPIIITLTHCGEFTMNTSMHIKFMSCTFNKIPSTPQP